MSVDSNPQGKKQSDTLYVGNIDYNASEQYLRELFGNSAYGKTVTNKEKFVFTTYGNEDNISKKINNPHFKDLWPKI